MALGLWRKYKKDSMLEGNVTLVQVLFPILVCRQVGMLEKTVDGPYYYATPAIRKRLSVLL